MQNKFKPRKYSLAKFYSLAKHAAWKGGRAIVRNFFHFSPVLLNIAHVSYTGLDSVTKRRFLSVSKWAEKFCINCFQQKDY